MYEICRLIEKLFLLEEPIILEDNLFVITNYGWETDRQTKEEIRLTIRSCDFDGAKMHLKMLQNIRSLGGHLSPDLITRGNIEFSVNDLPVPFWEITNKGEIKICK